MIKVILTKLESNHNNIRTTETKGLLQSYPEIGKGIKLLGESLDKDKDIRYIATTPVLSISTTLDASGNRHDVIQTQNSKYKIEYL